MVRLKLWQWLILATPIASIIIVLMVAAGFQIHEWGINWLWGVFTLLFVAWRWLLVKWTQPAQEQLETIIAEINQELETKIPTTNAETALQHILKTAENDPPLWEDWSTFWQRCQELVSAIALMYYPKEKYPLLNIYIPQAYGLIRGTVDDLDQWIQKLSPVLNQVTIGQAYQTYEVYRKLEPSARKLLRVLDWSQWIFNPVAALAKQASQKSSNQATQQLLINLGQMLRQAALRNLCRQAIALYSGTLPSLEASITTPTLTKVNTKTLQDILTQAEPVEKVAQKPVNILLVGRTGAGKSSLINTLFQAELATVDLLPSTDQIQSYHWQTPQGEALTLWDTPGYEQVNRTDLRQQVLDYAENADLLLLVTPCLDPALQMDLDFLKQIKETVTDLPTFTIVTQIDRLRPLREWDPPYNWKIGDRPKEISIREATQYRAQVLGEFCNIVLPIVTGDLKTGRKEWGIDILSLALIESLAPAKQLRLARFLKDLEARTIAAAKIIDHYSFQMSTTQGLTAMLKSPVLQFISMLVTGQPTLAYLLAEKIPVEELPIVIGKLQMAYELSSLLNSGKFDLLSFWPLLLENTATPDRNAWAFGHALVEYWSQNLSMLQLQDRFKCYLNQIVN